LIIGALPRRLARYVAAGAAADYFFDVWWRKGLTALFFNAFPVDRTGLRGRRGMATDLLDAGVPLLLFPEGTRSRTGDMGAFKPGAAALCISRDVPCLPVAIVGANEAMPRGRKWPDRGRPPIWVTFGEPLTPEDGESALAFSDRIAKEIRGLIDATTDQIASEEKR
jgi:1-acyl-sn-glycerol-3-phosphate acyltransferase